jgi:hypothetical protein
MLDDIKDLFNKLGKIHGSIHDSCLAKLGEKTGFLGYSSAVWTKVWFDTPECSTTLYEGSFENCKAKYEEYKRQMAVGEKQA